jgi:hypothetical protein
MTLQPRIYHLINTTPQRIGGLIAACFQPVFNPGNFHLSYTPEMNTLQINCQKWGDIGQIICQETQPDSAEIIFLLPAPARAPAVLSYENLIREECLTTSWMLADMFNENEIVMDALSEALYRKRLERRHEFISWLFSQLQIFGYRDLYLGPILNCPNKIDEYFDFPVKGTPAQFTIMLRQFSHLLTTQTEYQELNCQIFLPDNRKNNDTILPDTNPVEIKFALGKNLLTIHAHGLPDQGTLLRIHLNGENNLWNLWDKIRDEMEKLNWFTLPDIPSQSKLIEKEKTHPPINNQTPDKPWLSIPNVGANQEIIRYWHQGLTCTQIGIRVGLTEKTVLNKIHQLRKEYGKQIVPYRKSNFS